MDRLIYTAMSAAKHIKYNQGVISNNIANVNTDGFKKDFLNIVESERKSATRIMSEPKNTITNLSDGNYRNTGNPTDIVSVSGWLSGIDNNGIEHYFKTASLSINSDGMLVDGSDNLILNTNKEPIEVGDIQSINITQTGGINVIPMGGSETDMAIIDTIGIFQTDGTLNKDVFGNLVTKDNVFISVNGSINSGKIEGSNVIMAQEMLGMIENNRQYEFTTKLMESAKSMHNASTKILR